MQLKPIYRFKSTVSCNYCALHFSFSEWPVFDHRVDVNDVVNPLTPTVAIWVQVGLL